MFKSLDELKDQEFYWWKQKKEIFPVRLIILKQNVCVQGMRNFYEVFDSTNYHEVKKILKHIISHIKKPKSPEI